MKDLNQLSLKLMLYLTKMVKLIKIIKNDQNDHLVQDDEILNALSSPNIEDNLAPTAVSVISFKIPTPIPSMASPAHQDRWSRDKHIEMVNIVGNPGVRMLTRAMAKELSAALAHECLFVDFLSKEELKKVFKALKRLGWAHAMQEELN
ncbi:hypothetical protein Tco_1548773 [Tanacetum coccineum]